MTLEWDGEKWSLDRQEPLMPIKPWFLRKPPLIERPNYCFIGLPRQGKSLKAVELCLRRLRAGERVLSNIEIVDARFPWLKAEQITSWTQIVDPSRDFYLRDATVFIDEAGTWLDSRKWASVPGEVRAYWRMKGHRGVGFIFTCHEWTDVDKNMRALLDVVTIVTKVRGFPKRFPLYAYQTFLPEEFGLLDSTNKAVRMPKRYHFMPADVFSSYRTDEIVPMQDWDEYRASQVKGGVEVAI